MKYLQSDPDTMGGDLVIRGTRIPIDEVLHSLIEQGKSIADIHELYPWVDENLLKSAISEALTEAIKLLPQLRNLTGQED
jgi:uncharacterized protein (DUF433 family)